ncbi:hypothetical protein CMV_017483 [Castanea mollissima]|uniref:Uncharacterized protein n=1 Tax=Castanea mollissima TaxID=60419 RepID=A0A8J4R4W3_9ROSI|nr:hypothetical protein CMV_017483 [Castanea mollissima]
MGLTLSISVGLWCDDKVRSVNLSYYSMQIGTRIPNVPPWAKFWAVSIHSGHSGRDVNSDQFRSEKLESDPMVSTREPSATTTTATTTDSTSLSSSSWFAAIFADRMKKSGLFVYNKSTVERKPCLQADLGMSPARTSDSNEDCERSPLVWFFQKVQVCKYMDQGKKVEPVLVLEELTP